MKIYNNNKPIRWFRLTYYYYSDTEILHLDESSLSHEFKEDDVIELSNTPRTLDKKLFGTLTNGATLLFDKSSKFPRFKLKNTDFTRCIKEDRADFVIVGKPLPREYSNIIVLESKDSIFIGRGRSSTKVESLFLTKEGILVKQIYSGSVHKYTKNEQILLYPPNVPLINDEYLDKVINNSCEDLTFDSALEIIKLLKSPNDTNVELGVKILSTSNVSKYPITSLLILLSNTTWWNTKARHSVSVQMMLKTLKAENLDFGSLTVLGGLYRVKERHPYTAEDKELGDKILVPIIYALIEWEIRAIRTVFGTEGLGFNININVGKNEDIRI